MLSITYHDLGRSEDALLMAEYALEFCRRFLPPDHPLIGTSMGNLAMAYSDLAR
jgi:hypothetical protein